MDYSSVYIIFLIQEYSHSRGFICEFFNSIRLKQMVKRLEAIKFELITVVEWRDLKSSNVSLQELSTSLFTQTAEDGAYYIVTPTSQLVTSDIGNFRSHMTSIETNWLRKVVSAGKVISQFGCRDSFDSVPVQWLPLTQPCSDKEASLPIQWDIARVPTAIMKYIGWLDFSSITLSLVGRIYQSGPIFLYQEAFLHL